MLPKIWNNQATLIKEKGNYHSAQRTLSSTSSFENIWNSMAIVVRLRCWRSRLESVVHVVLMAMIRSGE